ncbi:unnamed protein product, partial [Meganyctiphanes norvegica]
SVGLRRFSCLTLFIWLLNVLGTQALLLGVVRSNIDFIQFWGPLSFNLSNGSLGKTLGCQRLLFSSCLADVLVLFSRTLFLTSILADIHLSVKPLRLGRKCLVMALTTDDVLGLLWNFSSSNSNSLRPDI